MKKKILAIGIIAMLFTMLIVLTGCGKTENENINDNNSQIETSIQMENKDTDSKETILTSFAKYINNKDYDNAIKLIDTDVVQNILKINLTQEELSKAYEKQIGTYEIVYDVNSITFIENSKIDETLQNYKIVKNPESVTGLFDDYDFYIIKYTMSENGKSTEMYDAMIIKQDGKSFAGTVVTNGILNYYYNAIYNKPTSETSN